MIVLGYLENQLEDVVRHVVVARGLLHQVEGLDEFERVGLLIELYFGDGVGLVRNSPLGALCVASFHLSSPCICVGDM